MEERNFGYLGFTFQQSLIKAIIEDKKYGETIIDVIEAKFFDNNSFRFIMENTKELYKSYNKIPNYDTLAQKIMAEGGNRDSSKVHLDTLTAISEGEDQTEYVKDTALNFCKQQNLKRELKSVQSIIESGEFESYSKIEQIIQKALQVGISNDDATDVFHNIDEALESDYRLPIATGIVGVDKVLKGGLGRGELGVVLAPTGTGKTTLLTKFANTAYNLDFNVLQIFFEDNPGNIKRKHYTIWTDITADEQPEFKDIVKKKVEEVQEKSKGNLRLLKLASDNVTIADIKSKVRKLNSDGFKIDLLIIDYIDCVSSEKSTNGEEWKGEGSVMRSLEAMTGEFDMAIWTATQGNRESISSEVVTGDQMGGSIKKAQVGHVIISIAKTLQQKEMNLATIAITKSRLGKDGVIFENCKFNNELLEIDTESSVTFLGFEEQKEEKNKDRVRELLEKRKQKEQQKQSN
jgi:replicative DNA helicase